MPVKILILGGGQVGSSVVENLCGDANDITVVDLDADLLKALQDRYDIQTIAGNAAHPSADVRLLLWHADSRHPHQRLRRRPRSTHAQTHHLKPSAPGRMNTTST